MTVHNTAKHGRLKFWRVFLSDGGRWKNGGVRQSSLQRGGCTYALRLAGYDLVSRGNIRGRLVYRITREVPVAESFSEHKNTRA